MKQTLNFLKLWSARILTLPTVVRLLHTFWQTFLAVWLVSGFAINKVALTAAIAAALSAAKTVLVQTVKENQINIPGQDS